VKQHCETCPTIQDCKEAFGRYWLEKSHGGVGCRFPFKYDRTWASRHVRDGVVDQLSCNENGLKGHKGRFT